ncbi:class I SAM-dependent RNA methyltransferase [Synechococcus sp. MW101C3]|uniref:THUMP domain-containing class I SAM-dependent RNA methyltransferase n=1 Tax=Synechococcus sp. MW101C3 TaxID=210768 RepID=UPI000B98B8BA|nr:THUMP domain-containing protein [Synechococcus sp. MW101C3]
MTEPVAAVAVLPQGLEQQGAEELAQLGASDVRPLRRAASFRIEPAGFYRVLLEARLPFRLLRRLAVFPCAGADALYDGIQRAADWDHWLPPDASFRVDVTGSAPGLNHSHFTALQVKNALVDLQRQRHGRRSGIDLDHPDLSLQLHLGGGQAQLSVEAAGSSLHRRGWRAAMGLAPLKENLAAGLIACTGWDGQVPLADPLCGSGTLLIEAACLALARAPGLLDDANGQPQPRRFAIEGWPDFDPELWRQAVAAAACRRRTGLADGSPLAPIVGREQNADVLEQARHNAAAAGVAPWIDLQAGDVRDFQPPETPGVLVCNPPYGERLGADDDLEALYSDLGRLLKERCSGWSLWLLSGNAAHTGALRMKANRRVPVSNGGIDCRWLNYTIR